MCNPSTRSQFATPPTVHGALAQCFPHRFAALGLLARSLASRLPAASSVSSGKVMDYAVEKCLDAEGNTRCSTPFLVTKSTCYELKWTTDGVLSHTTVEVRDAGSDEIVYYRDTDGEWTPEKGEVSAALRFSHVSPLPLHPYAIVSRWEPRAPRCSALDGADPSSSTLTSSPRSTARATRPSVGRSSCSRSLR